MTFIKTVNTRTCTTSNVMTKQGASGLHCCLKLLAINSLQACNATVRGTFNFFPLGNNHCIVSAFTALVSDVGQTSVLLFCAYLFIVLIFFGSEECLNYMKNNQW